MGCVSEQSERYVSRPPPACGTPSWIPVGGSDGGGLAKVDPCAGWLSSVGEATRPVPAEGSGGGSRPVVSGTGLGPEQAKHRLSSKTRRMHQV